MKLFLISQSENNNYNTYDSAVVAAETEEIAKAMNPLDGKPMIFNEYYSLWCKTLEDVKVQYLGEAVEGTASGIICASFNAG